MVLVLLFLFPVPSHQVSSAHALKLWVSSEEILSVQFAQHVREVQGLRNNTGIAVIIAIVLHL